MLLSQPGKTLLYAAVLMGTDLGLILGLLEVQ